MVFQFKYQPILTFPYKWTGRTERSFYDSFSKKIKEFYKKEYKIRFVGVQSTYGTCEIRFKKESDSTMFKLLFSDEIIEPVKVTVVCACSIIISNQNDLWVQRISPK
jgi:predicted secreted protein